jgi:hypothetical protein
LEGIAPGLERVPFTYCFPLGAPEGLDLCGDSVQRRTGFLILGVE